MMRMAHSPYQVGPDAPCAPSTDVWEAMSEAQRQRVLSALPSELPRAGPPEGDQHQLPKARSREVLREYFLRRGRSVYLGSELPVYYPDECVFAPDLIAVLDVDDHPREHWVVSHEGRGLDFVLEIHVEGDRTKDYETNVERFARLGVPEYLVYDSGHGRPGLEPSRAGSATRPGGSATRRPPGREAPRARRRPRRGPTKLHTPETGPSRRELLRPRR